jgi:hypothetical protein
MKPIHLRAAVGIALLLGISGIGCRPALKAGVAEEQTSAQPPAPAAIEGSVRLPIGMNLSSVNDYSPGYPFKNLMWGARPWLTKNADGTGPFNTELAERLALDVDGYPLEMPVRPDGVAADQIVFTILPNVTEAGRYVVLYEGTGEIRQAMSTRLVSSAPGRLVLELAGKGSDEGLEGIAIVRSARNDHVRNIRVLAEADEKADLKANPFRQDFLDYCKQWHALRFMDWMATNNSLAKEWRGRKRPSFYTMVGEDGDAIGRWGKPASEFKQLFAGGVAPELMVQLANMTQTNPWFCMPHRATPEYMTEFARLVKDTLDPKLKVYVEYSNEVWNWGFQQAGWMLQSKVAADAVLASGMKAWKNGVTPQFALDSGGVAKDGGDLHPERMAALDRRCFGAWEAIFTGKDRGRLVRVVGVQHAWPDTARRTAKWVAEHGGADAIAPAGYVGPNDEIYKRWQGAGAGLTADQVIADMNEAFEKDSARWTREIAAIARQFQLRYVVYEGGQHIQPKDQQETPYMPALKASQYHPGMFKLYMRNFALHQEIGCDLFAAFSSISRQGTRWGSWGHQEFYGQVVEKMPKYRALVEVNAAKR